MTQELLFTLEKKAVKKWLRGKQATNAWSTPLDENIATLIHTLNKLPFAYTHACCGGHVRTVNEMRKLLGVPPDASANASSDEFGGYSGAWFSFTVDGSDKSTRFVDTIRSLVSTWPGAPIDNLPQGERAFAVTLSGDKNKTATSYKEAFAMDDMASERIAHLIVFINFILGR